MLDIILISVFTFFAFCGVLYIITEITSVVARRNAEKTVNSYTVITVKDCENDVEGIIRSLAWKQLRFAVCGIVPELYAVDLGSCDGTFEILQRLALEYDFLKPVHSYEYIEVFTNGEVEAIRGNN